MSADIVCAVCGEAETWVLQDVDITEFVQLLIPHHPKVQRQHAEVAVCQGCGDWIGFSTQFAECVRRVQIEAATAVVKDLAELVKNSARERKRLVPVPVRKLAGLIHWALGELVGEEAMVDLDSVLVENEDE